LDKEPIMNPARRSPSFVPAIVFTAAFAAAALVPGAAMADDTARVESIAAKGRIPAVVPVESGLALGLVAGLIAFGVERRSRR
jgi:hypothetical protein